MEEGRCGARTFRHGASHNTCKRHGGSRPWICGHRARPYCLLCRMARQRFRHHGHTRQPVAKTGGGRRYAPCQGQEGGRLLHQNYQDRRTDLEFRQGRTTHSQGRAAHAHSILCMVSPRQRQDARLDCSGPECLSSVKTCNPCLAEPDYSLHACHLPFVNQ